MAKSVSRPQRRRPLACKAAMLAFAGLLPCAGLGQDDPVVMAVKQGKATLGANAAVAKAFPVIVEDGRRLRLFTPPDAPARELEALHNSLPGAFCKNALALVAMIPQLGGEVVVDSRGSLNRVTTINRANCVPPKPTRADVETHVGGIRRTLPSTIDEDTKLTDIVVIDGPTVVMTLKVEGEITKTIAKYNEAQRAKFIDVIAKVNCAAPFAMVAKMHGVSVVGWMEGAGVKRMEYAC